MPDTPLDSSNDSFDRTAVALLPHGSRPYLADAVRSGGGVITPIESASALMWADPADVEGLRAALAAGPGIRWVQLPWAGIEDLVPVLDDQRVWTSGKGVYAEEVAEHTLALALGGLRHIAGYARRRAWGPQVGASLVGAKVTILGGGGITESLLELLQPFRCDITVVRRQALPLGGAARTITIDRLDEALPDADLVVLALALTPDTELVLNERRLGLLSPHTWIVNVARGRHIDTDALVRALQEGRIGGAALDVTEPEPLPADHPLWTLPNCIITPHTANTEAMAVPVLMERVRSNVARFIAGEPLLGVVDVTAGY